jgi:hypothetical protein
MGLVQVQVPYRDGCDYGCGADLAPGSPRGKVATGALSGVEDAPGATGPTGATGPIGYSDGIIVDPTAPTLTGDGTEESPLQVINVAPQPFPAPQIETILYVRTAGNDVTGDGTLPNPYATVQRAVLDVPMFVPRGTNWIIDDTGITEVFPDDYTLPAWVCSELTEHDLGSPYFNHKGVVAIRATPQLVPLVPASDAIVTAADILKVTPNPVSGLLTVTLKAPRASWAGNALKGHFAIGAASASEHCHIGESTTTTVELAQIILPTTPFQIMEPSAHLSGANTDDFKGALNIFNCGSIEFSGQKIDSTIGGFGLLAVGCGFVTVQLCDLRGPDLELNSFLANRILRTSIKTFCYITGNFTMLNGGLDNCTIDSPVAVAPSVPQFRNMIIDGCDPIEVLGSFAGVPAFIPAATPILHMQNVVIRNGTGDGVRFHGDCGHFEDVDIYGCLAGNGITADLGQGVLNLLNVGTSGAPNGGVGVRVNDGMFVKVDAATSGLATPLTGAGGDMHVGSLVPRAWSDFTANPPIKNEYDLTTPFIVATSGAVQPGGDENAGVGTGGRSGSRLFQRA